MILYDIIIKFCPLKLSHLIILLVVNNQFSILINLYTAASASNLVEYKVFGKPVTISSNIATCGEEYISDKTNSLIYQLTGEQNLVTSVISGMVGNGFVNGVKLEIENIGKPGINSHVDFHNNSVIIEDVVPKRTIVVNDVDAEAGSKARRLQEIIVNNPPQKGNVINVRNIYNELNKSEVGRETLDYIIKNDDITINFYYHLHPNEEGMLGRIVGRNIDIFVPAHPINTKVNVAKTLIHEVTHASIGSLRNTRKEEVICFMREVLHDNNGITSDEIKRIIKEVNSLYEELPWR